MSEAADDWSGGEPVPTRAFIHSFIGAESTACKMILDVRIFIPYNVGVPSVLQVKELNEADWASVACLSSHS